MLPYLPIRATRARLNTLAGTSSLTAGAIYRVTDEGRFAVATANNAWVALARLDEIPAYAEGTFTPSLVFNGNAVGMTYSTQTGRYTRNGRQVLIEIEIALSNKGTSTGTAIITGLPFNATSTLFSGASRAVHSGMASVTDVSMLMAKGANTINLYNQTATAATQLSNTHFNNTSQLYINFMHTM